MPTWSQDQLNAMGALLAGTHDQLDPTPRIQPGYNVNDLYAGILPPASAPNRPYTPNITPAQLASIHAVPGNSYQAPISKPLNIPNEPRGYSNPDTGNYGRASGMMLQPLDINYPAGPAPAAAPPSVPLPRPRPAYPAGPVPEDALIAAGIKPGIPMAQQGKPANPGWLQTSRQLANVGFRQGAIQAANARKPTPALPAIPKPSAGIPAPVQAGHGAPAPAAPRPLPLTLSTNGYTYSAPGVKAGVTPWAAILTPAQQYEAANRAGQIAAIQRAQAAQASGQRTAVQNLQSQGNSAAQAYALANAQAAARAQASASSPSYQSSNSWFNSVTGR